jgi:hypothetical protein
MKVKTIILGISLILIHSSAYSSCKEVSYIKGNKAVKTKSYECDDGSVSFQQNSSGSKAGTSKTSKSGWEGMCGPTAAANVFNAYCKNVFIEPKSISTKYFSDWTPGVRPDTMVLGLNRLFDNNSECLSGTWRYFYADHKFDFLDSIYRNVHKSGTYWKTPKTETKISPMLVLIADKAGEVLHWVTVVDIQGYDPDKWDEYENSNCKVRYNEFGRQTTRSCADFSKRASNVDNGLSGAGNLYISEYTRIIFDRSIRTKVLSVTNIIKGMTKQIIFPLSTLF